jgi:hypothetical protein
MMRVTGTEGYGDEGEALARHYESLTFAGRDAAALAARGHKVVAVEPTPELRHFRTKASPASVNPLDGR